MGSGWRMTTVGTTTFAQHHQHVVLPAVTDSECPKTLSWKVETMRMMMTVRRVVFVWPPPLGA